MREVFAKLGEDIRLGRRGENLATRVTFDVSGWMSSGDGTIHLLHQRNGDNVPYPCAITVDGGTVKWAITAADVEMAGRGRAELQYLDGDVCKKSAIYTTNTLRALNKAGKVPPEPEEGWVQEVLEAKVAADNAASEAKTSASEAKTSAENAYDSALTAGACLLNTESYMLAAQSAAQTAAEDAAQAAVAEAENRLVGYQTNAASSAQSALQSSQGAAQSAQEAGQSALAATAAQKAAEEAQSAAETAADAAAQSEGNAKTFETNAAASAKEAKESAQGSAQAAGIAQIFMNAAEQSAAQAEAAATQAQSAAGRAQTSAAQAEEVVTNYQPDWDQSDSMGVGYIRNRPFYSAPGLDEVSVPMEAVNTPSGTMYNSPRFTEVAQYRGFYLVKDCDYLITYDGVEYNCKAFEYTTALEEKSVAIGNPELVAMGPSGTIIPSGAGMDTPFAILGGVEFRSFDGETHYVTIAPGVVKLPNEYLDAEYIKETALAGVSVPNDIVCTASGVGSVTVNDSAERPLRGLNIYGKTTQQTYTGKNLFHRDYEKTETTNGVTFYWDAETQELVLNGTVKANGDLKAVNPLSVDWVVGDAYTVSIRHTGGTAVLANAEAGGNSFAWSIFSKDLTKYFRGGINLTSFPETYLISGNAIEASGDGYVFYFQCWKVGTVFNNYRVKVQIESGNTPTDWEPYTGGIPAPNPYYPQELTNTNGAVIVSVIGEDKAYYQALWHNAPDGLPGIPVSADGNYTDVNGQQWICDEIDFKRGVYIQRVNKVIVPSWDVYPGFYRDDSEIFAASIMVADANQTSTTPAISNAFRYETMTNSNVTAFYITNKVIFARIQGVADAETFNSIAQNVEILYKLGTPVETPLPAEELAAFAELHSFYPTTSVSNENGADMAIEYVADTKSYIDKKIAELKTALLGS